MPFSPDLTNVFQIYYNWNFFEAVLDINTVFGILDDLYLQLFGGD